MEAKKVLADGAGTGMVQAAESIGIQSTGGHSFIEVNNQGQLVYWARSGNTFANHVRGSDWDGTHAITSLDTNTFLEIKPDYRLAKWTWTGQHYAEDVVGQGWQPARLIAGIASNRFIEINTAGELVLWEFTASNQLTRSVIGSNWGATRLIAGKGNINFMEVKGTGGLSDWYDFGWGQGVQEVHHDGMDLSDARLIAGLDLDRFLVVDTPAGDLFEYTLDPELGYVKVQRGTGWNNARLIG
ncbi:hypothetical protein KIPE111705_28880 [Kibdelosporangium persicum]|uniref:Tachylectin n=1 Tax=Kibdelosporangium persicum TaxID=2698649 RepID=A0ABX2F4R4_9PSEU|nr:hypothetical protein [Kibdelosporangium persicum]NRN66338.1 hypothetical protein [Kibdelosporangium persicum]